MKKYLSAALLALLLLCMTACSDQKNKEGDAPAPQPSDFTALTDIEEGRPDIYLIVKLIDSGYWQVIIKGAQEAGKDLDCNVYYAGTSIETDWQGQRKLLETAVSRGADAIILSPDDSVELSPDIEKIHKKSIPVILIDTAANTESFDICYMTDNLLAGENAAKEMLSKLHACGHADDETLSVGIIVGTSNSQTISERLAGFYQFWSANAPSAWTIISDIKNCNGVNEQGESMTVDLMNDYPDLAGLYGTNNGPTKALCTAVSKQGRKDLVIVGFDYSDEMKALLESDEYNASTMLQRQYDMSYNGVRSALDLLGGNAPEVKFTDTGVVCVNHDNLTDPDVVNVLQHN
ncbi:MAG: substrate-binding domain-containing protein [Lachnospiraceae bacterium]|nr:substrate-binding domain-containing protein [Lachnospiraceae bacterium]